MTTKKTVFTLPIFTCLIISCSTNKKVAQFENILGKENSKTLTYLVENFEREYLKKEYPSFELKDAYRQLIIDTMKDGGEELIRKTPEEDKARFKNSELRLDMLSVTDSVWPQFITDKTFILHSRRKSYTNDGAFHYSFNEIFKEYDTKANVDSIINREIKFVDLNYLGRYKKAFEKVFQEESFVKEYLKFMHNSGGGNPSVLTDRLINSNVTYDDYFIKRLILTTLVYYK